MVRTLFYLYQHRLAGKAERGVLPPLRGGDAAMLLYRLLSSHIRGAQYHGAGLF